MRPRPSLRSPVSGLRPSGRRKAEKRPILLRRAVPACHCARRASIKSAPEWHADRRVNEDRWRHRRHRIHQIAGDTKKISDLPSPEHERRINAKVSRFFARRNLIHIMRALTIKSSNWRRTWWGPNLKWFRTILELVGQRQASKIWSNYPHRWWICFT